MKLNKNRIIVSALGLVIGASLAGSVSGTIAWYQYSTRANVSYIGQSGGISSNLHMRFVSEANNPDAWRTRITADELNLQLGTGMDIVPMTFGALGKDDALPMDNAQTPAPLGYVQPDVGVGDMTKWDRATNRNYAQFQLQIRNINREGAAAANDEQDVFISKLVIQKDLQNPQGKQDISNALRVHIKSEYGNTVKNRLISNLGQDTATSGKLDIDGDGKNDQAYPEGDDFGFGYDNQGNRHVLSDVIYGDDNNANTEEIQKSYANTYDPEFGGVKFTAEDIALANALHGKTVDECWKVEPVDNSDPADGDYDDEGDVQGVRYTQAELDEIDLAYGKTTDDWKVEPADPSLVYSENNKLYDDEDKAAPAASKSIGKTVAGDASYLTVTITIWVEGWQKLDGSAIWDASKYIDSKFNVGIQFAVQDRQA